MTLLAEVQEVLERTYEPVGINLEECLINRKRCEELGHLAGFCEGDYGGRACTFLRKRGNALAIAIYYSPEVIEGLEREDPRTIISHRNIGFFIPFLEEITHGVHAALNFLRGANGIGGEQFACNLEVQGKVDIYYMLLRFCHLLTGERTTPEIREWVLARLFKDEQFDYYKPILVKRYRLAHRLAEKFIRHIECLPSTRRAEAIRSFCHLSLLGKSRYLRQLG